MRYFYSLILLLLLVAPATAQPSQALPFDWQQWYPQRLPVASAKTLKLPGGFLLIGSHTVDATRSALSLVRTNELGDTLWTRWRPLAFAVTEFAPALDPQGNVTLTSADHLLKLSAAGDTLWTRPMPAPAGASAGMLTNAVLDADGSYVVAYQLTQGSTKDVRLAKFSQSTGLLLWSYSLAASMPNSALRFRVLLKQDRKYLLVVEDFNTAGLIALLAGDTTPQPYQHLFNKTQPYAQFEFSIPTSDGGVMLAGSYVSMYLTASGTLGWYNSPLRRFTAIAQDAQGTLVTTAIQLLSGGVGHSSAVPIMASYKAPNIALGLIGIPYCTPGYGNANSGEGLYTSLLQDTNGNFIISGYATDVSRSRQLTMAGANVSALLSQRPATRQNPLQLTPNPAGGTSVQVQLPSGLRTGELTVTDALGRVQWQQPVASSLSTQTVPVDQLAAGLYLVRLTDPEGHVHSARLIRP